MRSVFQEVIWLSIFSGAILLLCPEGGVKRVLSVLCTPALALSVLPAARELNTTCEAAAVRQEPMPEQIEAQGEAASQQLQQLFIQSELETYVTDKAAALGIGDLQMQIETRQNTDSLWIPWASVIASALEPWQKEALGEMLQEDLGIPPERQNWNEYRMEE